MRTKPSMFSRLSHLLEYSWEFYRGKFVPLLIFSVPLVVALAIPFLVPAPTFLALGGELLRTGSLPDLTLANALAIAVAYLVSLFIISDAIANINLLIKSRRTLTLHSGEVRTALTTYAVRITYIYTVLVLLFAAFQLVTFEHPAQSFVYPLLVLLVSYLSFFVAPAIVIDNAPVHHALGHAVRVALQKPFLFVAWTAIGLILLSAVRLVFGVLLPAYASILTLLVNALFVLPFLIVLQTQMYLEKYPLAH